MIADTNDTPLILIPAAGFGRRVGSPPAKELLPDDEGRPLIEWSINQARLRGWPVHVVLRAEKTELVEWLQIRSREQALSWQTVGETRDCCETLLASEKAWRERNLVILPDTRWQRTPAIDEIANDLREFALCYGVHPVVESEAWGLVFAETGRVQIFEKGPAPGEAWGVLGFRREVGRAVLGAHVESFVSREPRSLQIETSTRWLGVFQDLTRVSV